MGVNGNAVQAEDLCYTELLKANKNNKGTGSKAHNTILTRTCPQCQIIRCTLMQAHDFAWSSEDLPGIVQMLWKRAHQALKETAAGAFSRQPVTACRTVLQFQLILERQIGLQRHIK